MDNIGAALLTLLSLFIGGWGDFVTRVLKQMHNAHILMQVAG